MIHNQAAEEDQQNFDVGNAKEQSPEQVKKEAESSSSQEGSANPAASGNENDKANNLLESPVIKPCHCEKKKGRKPKRKRKVGFSGTSKSRRLQKRRLIQ